MKIDARRIAAFLRDPGACRVVLLHGEDGGLIRERGDALVRGIAGTLDDPFRVSELDREALVHLLERATARPLTGGRGVVRVRDVTDAAAAGVSRVLANASEALVVLEAGALPPKSKLRALVEAAKEGASIACYSERGADLAATIRSTLSAYGLQTEEEAQAYLCAHLGDDRGTTRSELDKLALCVHPSRVVTRDDAKAVVGDLAGLVLADALDAATSGDVAKTGRALDVALEEGASAVSVLRQLVLHLQRLERARLALEGGHGAGSAMVPPMQFRREAALNRAAGQWPAEQLSEAAQAAWGAERDCKRSGAPAVVLARHLMLNVARRAAGRNGAAD